MSAARAKGGSRLKSIVGALAVLLLPRVGWATQVALGAQGSEVAAGSSAEIVAFWIFGALTLVGAALTVTRRNPVTAAISLVLTLFCIGGLYLVLHGTFLAAIQVLVYAGAIMVLFIFVVMAVARYDAEEFGLARGVLPKVLGLVAIGLLADRLLRVLTAGNGPTPGPVADTFGDVRTIGQLLFSDYLFPFEALSLLLLVAIVGAVMVTRRAELGEKTGEKGAG